METHGTFETKEKKGPVDLFTGIVSECWYVVVRMSDFLHNRSQNIPSGDVSTIFTFSSWLVICGQHHSIYFVGFFTVKMCFVNNFCEKCL